MRSARLRPAPATFTSTSPGPGCGSGCSRTSIVPSPTVVTARIASNLLRGTDRSTDGAADMSAVGVGDGERGAIEGRAPTQLVEHVVVVVAEEHEVVDDGAAGGP